MTLIVLILADFSDFIRVHLSDPRYQRRIPPFQLCALAALREIAIFFSSAKISFFRSFCVLSYYPILGAENPPLARGGKSMTSTTASRFSGP